MKREAGCGALKTISAPLRLSLPPSCPQKALYHCQQSAEKFLKAFLTLHQAPFRKTHDIRELLLLCSTLDASLEGVLTPALDLSQYAWRFRYPGAPWEPHDSEARAALGLARLVSDEITARIPPGSGAAAVEDSALL